MRSAALMVRAWSSVETSPMTWLAFGVLGQGNEGSAGAKDAGFFAGDLGDGVDRGIRWWSRAMSVMTERSGSTMLVASRRPPRPTSRMAIRCGFGEVEEGHRGDGFKELGSWGSAPVEDELGGGAGRERDVGGIAVGDRGAVDANAFVEAAEMRRGVEAGAKSRGGEYGGEGGGGRAFAVGSGDEDGGKARCGLPRAAASERM